MSKTTLTTYLLFAIILHTCAMFDVAVAKPSAAKRRLFERVRPGTLTNLKDPNERRQRVASLAKRAHEARRSAMQQARKKGWKVKGKARGRSFALKGIKNGRPVYRITNNANAAILIHADVARTTYNIDGSGVTVGI